jgi:hypothetical protein
MGRVVGILAMCRTAGGNEMNVQAPIRRRSKVQLWILGTITVLGMIGSIFMMIVDPTPTRLKKSLGVLCIVIASWADGSYGLFLGLTVPQVYREFRAGRGPPSIFAARLLAWLGLGLLVWAWLG